METVAVLDLQKPVESINAVPTESDQVNSMSSVQPEMEKAHDTVQTQGFELSKLSYEMKQAYRVYVELLTDSNRNVTWPFLEPVDVKAQSLWDYHERIKEPMSFAKIGTKFNDGMYNSITAVVSDMRLMLENCYRYNGPDHWVSKLGQKLEKVLEQKLALLNRTLREKVSLTATMALRLNCDLDTLNEGLGRRRTGRLHVNMLNREKSSSLISHLKIQEEFEERERRKQREKDKKEANEALLQELSEWEIKELTPDIKQLYSMWEVPSVVSLLYLLKDILDLQDINLTEMEVSFVYPSKSQLLAKVFTAMLLTPHQRKSLNKKPPMVFKVWESKLSDRVNTWYRVAQIDGAVMAAYRFGLDPDFYNILGEHNPLVEKSYVELSLHRRVWLLKCLCDSSVFKDYDIRDQLNALAFTYQRESVLGYDADNWSYLYFPVFNSTDLRVYRQCPLPMPPFSDKTSKVWKVTSAPPSPVSAKARKATSRPSTPTQSPRHPRLRKLRRSSSPEPEDSSPSPKDVVPTSEEEVEEQYTTASGFERACHDIESLQALCRKFEAAAAAPPPKKRGRRPKATPSNRQCEIDLYRSLDALLEDMEQHDARFSKAASKAKAKVMRESQEPEPLDKPEEKPPSEEEEDWASEGSIGEIPIDTSDEEFVLEEDAVKQPTTRAKKVPPHEKEEGKNEASGEEPSRKRKLEVLPETGQKSTKPPENEGSSCNIAIQTPPLKLKKKHKTSSSGLLSVTTCGIQGGSNASSAMAKLITAVPPAVNKGAVCGGATPLSKVTVVQSLPKPGIIGLVSSSPGSESTTSPGVMLKRVIPVNKSTTSPGVIPVNKSQTWVINSGSTRDAKPSSTSMPTTATQNVVSCAIGANQQSNSSPSTNSTGSSIISLPSSVLTQLCSTTKVMIGGKLITYILGASPSGAQVSNASKKTSPVVTPAARPVSLPRTRPLILTTARGRQAPVIQPIQPAAVASTVSQSVVDSSATSSHVQASTPVLKNVCIAVSRPALQTAVCCPIGSTSTAPKASVTTTSVPLNSQTKTPLGIYVNLTSATQSSCLTTQPIPSVSQAGVIATLSSSVPSTSQAKLPALTTLPIASVSKPGIAATLSSSVPSTSQAKLPVGADGIPTSRPLASTLTTQPTPKMSRAGVAATLLSLVPSTSQAKLPVGTDGIPTSRHLASTLTIQPTPKMSRAGVAATLSSSVPSTSQAKLPVGTDGIPTSRHLASTLTIQPTPKMSRAGVASTLSSSVPSTSQAKLPVRADVIPTSRPLASTLTIQPTPKMSRAGVAATLSSSVPSTSQAKLPVRADVIPTSRPLASTLTTQPTPTMSKASVTATLSSPVPSTSQAKLPVIADVIPTSGHVASSLTIPPIASVSKPGIAATLSSQAKLPVGTDVNSTSRPLTSSLTKRPTVQQVTTQSSVRAAPNTIAKANVSNPQTSSATQSTSKQASNQGCFRPAMVKATSTTASGAQVGFVSSSSPSSSSGATQPIPKQALSGSSAGSAVSIAASLRTSGAQMGCVSSSSPLPSSGASHPILKQALCRSSAGSAVPTAPSLATSGAQVGCDSSSSPLSSSVAFLPTAGQSHVVSSVFVAPSPTTSRIQASAFFSSPAHAASVAVVTDTRQLQSIYPAVPVVSPFLSKIAAVGRSVDKTGAVTAATVTASAGIHHARVSQSGSHKSTPEASKVQGTCTSSPVPSLQEAEGASETPLSTTYSDVSKLSDCGTVETRVEENENDILCTTKVTDGCSNSLPSSLSQENGKPVEEVTITSTTEKRGFCISSDATAKRKILTPEVISQRSTDDILKVTDATAKAPTLTLEGKVAITETVTRECSSVAVTLEVKPGSADGDKVPTVKLQDSSSVSDVSVNVRKSKESEDVGLCNGVSDNEQSYFIHEDVVVQADQDDVAVCNGSSNPAVP